MLLTILQRTLGFPFFFGLAFVGAVILFLKWMVNYVRFGGEAISYTNSRQRKTIQDVFDLLVDEKLDQKQNKQ